MCSWLDTKNTSRLGLERQVIGNSMVMVENAHPFDSGGGCRVHSHELEHEAKPPDVLA